MRNSLAVAALLATLAPPVTGQVLGGNAANRPEPPNVQSFGQPVPTFTTALSLYDAKGTFIGRKDGDFVYIQFSGSPGTSPILLRLPARTEFQQPSLQPANPNLPPPLVFATSNCQGPPVGVRAAAGGTSSRSHRVFIVLKEGPAFNLYEVVESTPLNPNYSYWTTVGGFPYSLVCAQGSGVFSTIKNGPLDLSRWFTPPFFVQ